MTSHSTFVHSPSSLPIFSNQIQLYHSLPLFQSIQLKFWFLFLSINLPFKTAMLRVVRTVSSKGRLSVLPRQEQSTVTLNSHYIWYSNITYSYYKWLFLPLGHLLNMKQDKVKVDLTIGNILFCLFPCWHWIHNVSDLFAKCYGYRYIQLNLLRINNLR